jgi:hypothetical protein
MNRPTQPPNRLYTAVEAAAMLRCSAWWLKKECRQGRAPYSWIGGSYHFTDEHIADIIHRFEKRPTDNGVPATQVQSGSVTSVGALRHNGSTSAWRAGGDRGDGTAIRLRARPPRRTRANNEPTTTAA